MKNVWISFALKVAAWVGAALALFLLTKIFLGGPMPALVSGALFLGALHIGLLDRTPLPVGDGKMLKRGVALLMVTFGAWLGMNPGSEEKIPWVSFSNEALETARQAGRPVMIDFTSKGCPFCLEMERNVFSNTRVADAARDFIALRADLTGTNALMHIAAEQFGVISFPTIVFLGPDGKERVNLRLIGYEDALRFAHRVQQAR